MLFNSQLLLLVFHPAALVLQRIVAKLRRLWIANLLCLSAIFYSYRNPSPPLLLVGSIPIDWGMAQQFGRSRNTRWLTAGIVADLAIRRIFKYVDFFLGSVASVAGVMFNATLMWFAIAMAFPIVGPFRQTVVRTRLRPHRRIAVALAVVLSCPIVELGGKGGAEFVYLQF
jgi:D-alanyl-lipoteichoic acid acyltransferase DltB (MBOAT superfamily)